MHRVPPRDDAMFLATLVQRSRCQFEPRSQFLTRPCPAFAVLQLRHDFASCLLGIELMFPLRFCANRVNRTGIKADLVPFDDNAKVVFVTAGVRLNL